MIRNAKVSWQQQQQHHWQQWQQWHAAANSNIFVDCFVCCRAVAMPRRQRQQMHGDIVCISVILNARAVNSTVPKLADAFNYGDR